MQGAACSAEGMVFDGNDDYVDLTPWAFGGAFTFEADVKYDAFQSWSRIFDFGQGTSDTTLDTNVILTNEGTSGTCAFGNYESSLS